MTQEEEKKEDFLRRWSRRKHEEKNQPPAKEEKPAPPLPAVDKLTPESDFSPFMHPKVEDALRRVALKKLFSDPHFNTPDPFEPYSRDWNVADPISDEMREGLEQWKALSRKPPEKEKNAPQREEVASEENEKPKQPDEPGKQDA